MYKQTLIILLTIFIFANLTYATPASSAHKSVRTLKQFKMKRGVRGRPTPARREPWDQPSSKPSPMCVSSVLFNALLLIWSSCRPYRRSWYHLSEWWPELIPTSGMTSFTPDDGSSGPSVVNYDLLACLKAQVSHSATKLWSAFTYACMQPDTLILEQLSRVHHSFVLDTTIRSSDKLVHAL